MWQHIKLKIYIEGSMMNCGVGSDDLTIDFSFHFIDEYNANYSITEVFVEDNV